MKLKFTVKFLSLFVATAFLLTSCDKDDKNDNITPDTGADTVCKLTKISDGVDYENVVKYNASGNISKIIFKDISSDNEDEYRLFVYDGENRLIKAEYHEDGLEEYTEFTYTNGVVSMEKWYYGSGELGGTKTYTFDNNGRVSEILDVSFYSNEATTYKYVFTYDDNGNVTTKKTYYSDGYYDNELNEIVTYENYDDKNRYESAIKGVVELREGSSKNNPGKITVTYYSGNEPYSETVTTFSYTYNDRGFPTKIVETDADGEKDISNFTYQCN